MLRLLVSPILCSGLVGFILDYVRKISKKVLEEFIFGGHLLSLGASSIVWTILLILDLRGGWQILLLPYLISQIVYNNDHLHETNFESLSSNYRRTKYLLRTKNFQIVTLFIYVMVFSFSVLLMPFRASVLAIIIVLGGVLYTFKIKNLTKKILGFKNLYVALMWAFLSFLVPLYYSISSQNLFFTFFAFYVFLRWVVNSTFFDIKDVISDKKEGLKTLPVILGIKKTILVLHIFNILSGLLLLISVMLHLFSVMTLTLLAFPIYGFVYLYRADKLGRDKLLKISYIIVDGEYVLWPLMILLGKSLASKYGL